MEPSPSDNIGTPYIALGWALTFVVVASAFTRLYSRALITRSFGSDDIAIIFSVCLSVTGEILDTLAYANGLGKHRQFVPDDEYAQVLKWEFILWIMVYISFFFVRTSVMLFTLRLLPATKLWAARIVCFAMFLNFATTVFAVVSWGLVCVPFDVAYKRLYQYIPIQHCESEKVTVAAQKVNGTLACLIDITTALIPTSLVWNIRIKRKTKIILDAIFLLGLITSGLSIGRALTFPGDIWTNDTTWRLIKSSTFSLIEEKLGIIFASCPALRQFLVYVSRHRTVFPTDQRDAPGEDFIKMRTKVKLREIFWASRPKSATNTMLGTPIHPHESLLDERTRSLARRHGKLSALDTLWSFGRKRRRFGSASTRSGSLDSTWYSTERSRPSKSSASGDGMRAKPDFSAWPGMAGAMTVAHAPAGVEDSDWAARWRESERREEHEELEDRNAGQESAHRSSSDLSERPSYTSIVKSEGSQQSLPRPLASHRVASTERALPSAGGSEAAEEIGATSRGGVDGVHADSDRFDVDVEG